MHPRSSLPHSDNTFQRLMDLAGRQNNRLSRWEHFHLLHMSTTICSLRCVYLSDKDLCRNLMILKVKEHTLLVVITPIHKPCYCILFWFSVKRSLYMIIVRWRNRVLFCLRLQTDAVYTATPREISLKFAICLGCRTRTCNIWKLCPPVICVYHYPL